MQRSYRLFIAAAIALTLGACAPLSVTFTLGARDGRLRETAVIEDDASSWWPQKVALIDVRGVIVESPPARALGLLPGGSSPVDDFVAQLKQAEDDDAVRAVVLRINSPGGSVAASDIMYRELLRFRERTGKPVIASLGEVAASGGYYLALGADEIIAQPSTITASIGVIIPTVNVSDGLRRIGVVARSVKSGQNKDIANPLEPVRETQYDVLQAMVDEFYADFLALVIDRRTSAPTPIDASRIDDLTDGRIVTGAQAVRAGLADRTGDLRDAFDRAKQLADAPKANLIKYHDVATPRPQTPYALTAAPPLSPQSRDTNISLVNIDLGDLTGSITPGRAYYLWLGGEN